MEYPFKDLLPLDEVLAREGYYKDWTHLDPEVFYSLTQISEYIKTKGYGVDVRLLIAQLAEHFGLKTTQVVDLGNLLTAEHATLKTQVEQAVSQVNADRNALETQFNQSVAQMQADKDAVIANATVDSEVILARGGKPTLQGRLDDTTAQLAQTTEDIFHGQLTNKMAMKPSLTIIDDDGRPKVYTHLKLLAEEYNIPITSAVITGRIGVNDSVHINKAQMQELVKDGFEFVSHTKTHAYLATLTEAEIETELKESSDWLNENGFDGHSTIVYPFGSYNASVLRIARKYYKSGFDIPINGGNYVKPILNQFAIQRVAYNFEDGTYDTANIKAKIDESIANNGWTIAMTHAGYSGFTIAGLREIVEYAKSKGVDIITVKEGLNRFGNLIDVSGSSGSASIGADGQLSVGFRNAVSSSHIKVGTPITEYPAGLSLTNIIYNHVALPDFPLNSAGSLETYNPSNSAFAYQKYITYADKEVYFRSWNTTSGEWESWEKQSNAHHKSATASTAFTEFKVGFTTSYVSTDNASGLPDSAAGTLITHKPSSLPATCYQTFKKYNSNDTYIRHQNSAGTWGDWINISRPHEDERTVDTVNGWATIVRFSKTLDGQVWLRGSLTAGVVTPGTVIATLPYGYSTGAFYPRFSVHDHTQNKYLTDAIQISGRNLVLQSSEIETGDSIRFSTYFQTTEN